MGIKAINPFDVPLLNTTILLASGATITWAHMALMGRRWLEAQISLISTVALGVYFTCLQGIEYLQASFCISDGVYGACFYVTTGFHGLHVVIGTTFNGVILYRNRVYHFRGDHHFGFEARA